MSTIESIRAYFGNDKLTLRGGNEIRIEEKSQTIGQVFESETEVIDHLRVLAQDNGNEWNGVDASMLRAECGELSEGLKYIAESLWVQLA